MNHEQNHEHFLYTMKKESQKNYYFKQKIDTACVRVLFCTG